MPVWPGLQAGRVIPGITEMDLQSLQMHSCSHLSRVKSHFTHESTFHACDLDPMTFTYKHLTILKMYPHTKNKLSRSRYSKYYHIIYTQTDAAEISTTPLGRWWKKVKINNRHLTVRHDVRLKSINLVLCPLAMLPMMSCYHKHKCSEYWPHSMQCYTAHVTHNIHHQ